MYMYIDRIIHIIIYNKHIYILKHNEETKGVTVYCPFNLPVLHLNEQVLGNGRTTLH